MLYLTLDPNVMNLPPGEAQLFNADDVILEITGDRSVVREALDCPEQARSRMSSVLNPAKCQWNCHCRITRSNRCLRVVPLLKQLMS